MNLARLSVKNPVFANLVMVAVLVLGLVSYFNLPRELMTEISMNWAFIITPYPGVPPEEIERTIAIPIEDEIQDVEGIESLTTQATEGSNFISVKFEQMDDDEFRARFEDLRAEVDRVADLPADAEDTVVQNFTTTDMVPVISVHLYGQLAEKRLLELSTNLKDLILDVPGVSKVERQGVREREIWVEANPVLLEGYGLGFEDLRRAIAAQGVNIPAGKITSGRQELLVRTLGEFHTPDEISEVIIRALPDGQRVRVGDVATVREDFEKVRTRSQLDGQPVVSLTISKRARASSIAVTDEIKQVAKAFAAEHSREAQVGFTQDSSEQIQDILSKLVRNAWFGLGIVLVVLFLVLGIRNAILAALGIPISFFACFIFLDATGASFNGNSLFGLVLVLGIIVDDAIIIVENCYRHLQQGKPWPEAAIDGTREVMGPVLSATATTIAVFLPLMLLPGIVGKFMRIIPVTVSLALLASMVEAFLILPAHFAEWPGKGTRKKVRKDPDWLVELRDTYERGLRWVLRKRYWFAMGVLPALLVGAGAIIPLVGVDMFAGEEVATFQVRVELPTGTSLDATTSVLEEFEREARKLPKSEVRAVHATAGLVITDSDWVFRTHVGQVWLDLTPSYERDRSADEIMADLRARVASIPGPTHIELAKLNTGPPMGRPVEVKIKGKDFDQLELAAEEIKAYLRNQPGVVEVDDDYEPGKREVRVKVDPERAAMYGLDVAQVGLALRAAVDGVKADTMFDHDEELDIVVRVDPDLLSRPEDLLRLPLATPTGRVVPLGQVASYTMDVGYAEIRRYKQQRAITVGANVDETVATGPVVAAALEEHFKDLGRRYSGVTLDFTGEFKEFKESFVGIAQLFLFGLLLIFGILGTQFRSYIQPLVILLTVPFAFVGAGLGLLISGNPFSVITLFGIVALAGVAVNDAIVLMSFINNRKAEGVDPLEAVVEAGRLRLRPILLTSLTTIAGLVPMAIGLGGMSLTWGPLANTIVWGLGVGTLLTIFMVPATYMILVEDIAGKFKRKNSEASKA